jgi:hypothetical protein
MTGEVLHDLPPAAAVGGGRAEIDTSAPFESVREAVDRFGGSAAWSSHLVRRIFAHHKVTLLPSPRRGQSWPDSPSWSSNRAAERNQLFSAP